MYRFTASFWCAAGILNAFQNPPRVSTEDDIFGSSFFVLPTRCRNILLASHLVGYGTTTGVPTLALHQVSTTTDEHLSRALRLTDFQSSKHNSLFPICPSQEERPMYFQVTWR